MPQKLVATGGSSVISSRNFWTVESGRAPLNRPLDSQLLTLRGWCSTIVPPQPAETKKQREIGSDTAPKNMLPASAVLSLQTMVDPSWVPVQLNVLQYGSILDLL